MSAQRFGKSEIAKTIGGNSHRVRARLWHCKGADEGTGSNNGGERDDHRRPWAKRMVSFPSGTSRRIEVGNTAEMSRFEDEEGGELRVCQQENAEKGGASRMFGKRYPRSLRSLGEPRFNGMRTGQGTESFFPELGRMWPPHRRNFRGSGQKDGNEKDDREKNGVGVGNKRPP